METLIKLSDNDTKPDITLNHMENDCVKRVFYYSAKIGVEPILK